MTKGSGKWKQINSKIVHENPWYAIRQDKVIMPNGKDGVFFVICGHESVMIVAENADGKVYLSNQLRYVLDNKCSWEMIGGAIDKSETPLKAAKRELKEEAGLTAKKWTKLGILLTTTWGTWKSHIFLAQNLTRHKQHLEDSEEIIPQMFSVSQIKKMITEGKIIDSPAITSLSKYFIYKENLQAGRIPKKLS